MYLCVVLVETKELGTARLSFLKFFKVLLILSSTFKLGSLKHYED